MSWVPHITLESGRLYFYDNVRFSTRLEAEKFGARMRMQVRVADGSGHGVSRSDEPVTHVWNDTYSKAEVLP